MRRVLLVGLFFCMFVGIGVAKGNIAILETGGNASFYGKAWGDHTVERVFDGNEKGNHMTIDIVRVAANKDGGAIIERIWDSKVSISKIELDTTGSGCVYEYKLLYWDLVEQEWNEIIYIKENSSAKVVHEFKTPIVTNKMRFIPYKAGPSGTENYINIKQISYYGELSLLPPNE